MPTEVFGPYLVYERLGVGGMAQVHRAKKRGIEGFERVCALKRMLPHLAQDADFVKSFVREGKLAAVLQHANISQIYELGRVGHTYFMAMEYVEGYDLRKLLRQARRIGSPPPVEIVLAIVGDLCDALDYAHSRTDDTTGEPLGIVHRDVSPSNLIVGHRGHLKVIDFGIAKATAAKLMTDTGRVKGKLGYMSPEAVRGHSLDARSDIFSVGIIAYELLAVRPLFACKSDYETLTKIQRGDVTPPSVHNPKVPIELDDLILKALAKSPHERWPTAAAMREALHRVALAYHLSATHRKVAQWCEWAFDQSGDGSRSGGVPAWRPPTAPPIPIPSGSPELPVAEADDEVVEIAWGGRNPDSLGPVVVGDIPDVSDQLPVLSAAANDVDIDSDQITAVNEVTTPGKISAKSPPVPRRLHPRITFVTPTPTPRSGATTPLPEELPPPPLPPDADLGVAAPPARADRPAAMAIGTFPPARRTALGTTPPPDTGAAVTTLPPRTAAEHLRRFGTGTEKLPAHPDATAAAPHRRRRGFAVAVAIGAAFGTLTAATAFFVRDGDRAAAPDATDAPVLAPAPALPGAALPDAAPSAATVTVRSTPPGLAVAIDERYLPRPTPVTVEVEPGDHDIALADRGVVMWNDRFHAGAGHQYTFHPVLESGGHAIVSADSVTKRHGELPEVDGAAEIRAKLCIDRHGKVDSVDLQKAPHKLAHSIKRRLGYWRYEPYRIDGKRARVCFAVALELD